AGGQIGDVAACLGDHTGQPRNYPEPVRAVNGHQVGGSQRWQLRFLRSLAYGDLQRAVDERLERGFDLGGVRLTCADQSHCEVSAQQGHRGVLEVHAAPRQHLRSLRDDARAVMTDDGDGKRGHRGILSPLMSCSAIPSRMSDSLTISSGTFKRAEMRASTSAPPVITSARPGCIDGNALIPPIVIWASRWSNSCTAGSGITAA